MGRHATSLRSLAACVVGFMSAAKPTFTSTVPGQVSPNSSGAIPGRRSWVAGITLRWSRPATVTLGTTVFVEARGKTTVTLTVLYESREARDGVLKSPMEEGMAAGYDRLEELLASHQNARRCN